MQKYEQKNDVADSQGRSRNQQLILGRLVDNGWLCIEPEKHYNVLKKRTKVKRYYHGRLKSSTISLLSIRTIRRDKTYITIYTKPQLC